MLREKRRHANSKPNRKLDRKSSRGMIYENEELRLRTININAEVERGQSDIKKLRRENDHLRREIWSLRDEYDRLDKLLRANQGLVSDIGDRPHVERTLSFDLKNGERLDDEDDDDEEEEEEEEEEERVCSQCNLFEESCECTLPASELDKLSTAAGFRPRPPPRDKLNFDDLSVVSEETTHSTDTAVTDPDSQRLSLNAPALDVFEFQSNVPSLSHFENLCYEKIGPNLSASGELVFDQPLSAGSPVDMPTISPPAVPEAFQDNIGPPDICMYNAGQSMRVRPRSSNGAVGRFPTGGNLEDLLHDLDNLSVDNSMMHGDKKRKQRSEMNLILTIDGDISTISPVTPAAIPISVDSPAQQPTTPAPIGWKPDLPPKPDKPPKPKFPWVTRAPGPLATDKKPTTPSSANISLPPPTVMPPPPRRKSIPVAIDQSQLPQAHSKASTGAAATATISKRRFSLRRGSDAKLVVGGGGGATGGGGGSSVERTTTHSISSSPESSSLSSRSQRPQPRRISTGSHDNTTGSIPWCACWGNGCI